jgi:glycosyltransferase involved in cell wall biosynthesis
MRSRILYLQFADPAAYPPIQHSTQILAERGWDVVLIGTDAFGADSLRLPNNSKILVRNIARRSSRNSLALLYVRFLVVSVFWVWTWRPRWIYVSDPLAVPASWIIQRLTTARMLYHEHDAPNFQSGPSKFMQAIRSFRQRLARSADLCVIPQSERLREFVEETRRRLPTYCVWNCPRRSEISTGLPDENSVLVLWYHGSINEERVPLKVVEALARFKGLAKLMLAGYETIGSKGYISQLMKVARERDVPEAVEFVGAIPQRHDLLKVASSAHVGLSLMPKASEDVNLCQMVGASNKPFDYMALGLPLLVSDLDDWQETFVVPEYGRACDPENVDSIEAELRWFLEHPKERRMMGQRCAEQIRDKWNYETSFAAVLEAIEQRA